MSEESRNSIELSLDQRLARLAEMPDLHAGRTGVLRSTGALEYRSGRPYDRECYRHLPTAAWDRPNHFLINGREVPVPMAIEEPSVIAGASFMAKLARTGGGFKTIVRPTRNDRADPDFGPERAK